jgi:hypothetical protein
MSLPINFPINALVIRIFMDATHTSCARTLAATSCPLGLCFHLKIGSTPARQRQNAACKGVSPPAIKVRTYANSKPEAQLKTSVLKWLKRVLVEQDDS